ncbi:type II secretion system F family protein [Actinocrispum wychmicini]|uniref:Type II secretion system (T2SS) protein F n=1 Tax=Actinocrispum wychmicini TaxID=1213861 RepID=A0A4R2K3C9_9PSEU|nr:type II secretion system F family protein [Actinocrispum wychmicini]TCO64278.1 type II secretion system (T2SS) protein F [Actinocrispum wychmicini]
MIDFVLAALLLAAAIVVEPSPAIARCRLSALLGHRPARIRLPSQKVFPFVAAVPVGVLVVIVSGWLAALPVSVIAWFGARRLLRRPPPPVDPLRLAAGWDLLAACLRAGMPVPTAIRVIADRIPGAGGTAMRATADLLMLGADPVDAWRPVADVTQTAAFARSARRTARSGTELATVAAALANDVRVSATDVSEVRAQRASVLIAGPLGLCFLPAFMCLGIAPVIAGLAGRLGLAG